MKIGGILVGHNFTLKVPGMIGAVHKVLGETPRVGNSFVKLIA